MKEYEKKIKTVYTQSRSGKTCSETDYIVVCSEDFEEEAKIASRPVLCRHNMAGRVGAFIPEIKNTTYIMGTDSQIDKIIESLIPLLRRQEVIAAEKKVEQEFLIVSFI